MTALNLQNCESYARLAEISFPASSKLFSNSWCPTMDLFVMAVPLSNRHRLGLWKMGGTKVWDVEVFKSTDGHLDHAHSIINVAWSPDGLQIAVAHDPPRLSFHSVHNGGELRSIELSIPEKHLEGVWWMQGPEPLQPDGVTKLLRREGNVPGSAHSVLQMLPLLDALSDDTPSTSAQLFNIKRPKKNTASHRKSVLPPELERFPALPSDPVAASISNVPATTAQAKSKEPTPARRDERDRSLENTIVVTSDDKGMLYLFLEGSYPLGEATLGFPCSIPSIHRPSPHSPFFAHPKRTRLIGPSTTTGPVMLRLPLLESQSLRNVAKLSTTVRTLLVYIIKVLEEMRRAWFGTDTLEGGRDVGRKWIKVLEDQEKAFDGATSKTNPIWDLTNLLFTGKTSGAMREFLGGHGKLSERGMAQWEATVQGSLTVLQESAERRVSPACERLIIVLEEARGWAVWSQQYAPYMFARAEIDHCLALAHRAIELSEWLSKTAEIEFERFHEFMKWMKAESARVADGMVSDLRAPTYDPLEVSEYLDHGLLSSPLDKWFLGPVPQLNPSEAVRPSVVPRSMADLLAEVNSVVEEGCEEDPWRHSHSRSSIDAPFPPGMSQANAPLEDLDRNLLALANELAVNCAAVFDRAAGATGRQAVVVCSKDEATSRSTTPEPSTPPPLETANKSILLRDRLVIGSTTDEDGEDMDKQNTCTEYVAVVRRPSRGANSDKQSLVIFSLHYENSEMEGEASHTGYCVFDCRAEEVRDGNDGGSGDEDQGSSGRSDQQQQQQHQLEVLDLAFFDDDTLLMVTRTIEPGLDETGAGGRAFLMSVPYSEASYKDISVEGSSSLEELADTALQMEVSRNPLPVKRARLLNCCSTGTTATLAVNGRENRRCACVVEESGQSGEIFDIDAEGDDEEEDEEEGEEGGEDEEEGGSQGEREAADGMVE